MAKNRDFSRDRPVGDVVAGQADRGNPCNTEGLHLIRGGDAVLIEILPDPQVEPLRIRSVENAVAITIEVDIAEGIQIRTRRGHLGDKAQFVAGHLHAGLAQIDEQPTIPGR